MTTVDLAKLATPTRGTTRGRSIYDDWIDTLADNERAAVIAAATDRAWGHTALLEVLISEGAPKIAATSFQMWRHKIGLPR